MDAAPTQNSWSALGKRTVIGRQVRRVGRDVASEAGRVDEEVEQDRGTLDRMGQDESATARAGEGRFADRGGGAGGDDRVVRVAATVEELGGGVDGSRMSGGDE